MNRWTNARARQVLFDAFDAAVASANPARVLAAHLPELPTRGRVIVLGAGKAAAAMAAAVEAAWPDVPLSGLVVTAHGHAVPTQHIAVAEAAHPVPDAAGEAAAHRILALAHGAGPDDLVLALISGGGSALLSLPAPGLMLAHKQAINRALLASGATIAEMNLVRRHLSAIKGGRLARAAAPARLVTLLISDVPSDDPAVIASGPTVPPSDPGTPADVLALLARYRIDPPDPVSRWLRRDPEPEPARPAAPDVRLIASPAMALRAAAAVARAHGLAPLILGDALEGESREVGRVMAGIARSAAIHGQPLSPPALLLSGGETTVTVMPGAATGRGGRNTEFLLAFALAANALPDCWALAADTDGIDGNADAAGALAGPDTLPRARTAGLSPQAALDRHDSATLFDALGDLVRTGPTLTNVNDFRAILLA